MGSPESVERYDVAVIGAGPAGAIAARDSAGFGLSTIILEEDSRAGEPVHCAECMSAFAAENTGLKVPEEVISKRVSGVRVIFPNRMSRKVIEDGFILDKAKFEQWLTAEACSLGAKVRFGAKVTGLSRDQRLWSITTAQGNVAARIVIDGSGVQAVSNRLLSLNQPFDFVVGVQYEIDEVGTDGFIDFYLWPGFAPDGYLWIIPKANNVSNVGLITRPDQKIRPLLDKFLEEIGIQKNRVNKKFGGKIPSSGPLNQISADGLLLVGDAAGLTSPLFEGGTHLALKSGQFAARTAKHAIATNDISRTTLAAFNRACRLEFPDYQLIIKGRSKLYALSEDGLNQLALYVPEEITEFTKLQKAIQGIRLLTGNPGLIGKGAISALKAFELSRSRSYGW